MSCPIAVMARWSIPRLESNPLTARERARHYASLRIAL